MSLLTDTDIETIICTTEQWTDKNKLHIYPNNSSHLTPIGYDLSVGNDYAQSDKPGISNISKDDKIIINPKQLVLIKTLERVGMPKNKSISALIVSKVSLVSQGLSHISTSVDPDWDGELLISMYNNSIKPIELLHGSPFCTAIFFANRSPATRDGNKPPGRPEFLMEKTENDIREILSKIEHEKTEREAERERINKILRKKQIWRNILSPLIIIIGIGGGYAVFGNNPGFIATVAGSVGVSQLILSNIKV